MEKFTKGPWHVVKGDEWTSDIATDTPEQGVWTVASANKRRDEFEANKRLIAAAPDMFAALERARDYIQNVIQIERHSLGRIQDDTKESIDVIRRAIAKAEG